MAISHSRKEGWIIIPKDEDEQYDAMMLLIKRVEELQHDIDAFGKFTKDEFRELVAVCAPSEKLLLRYVLAKVFGIEDAAKRYGMSKESLGSDVNLVTAALAGLRELEGNAGDVADDEEREETNTQPSKHIRTKAFHESLAKLHHGGRVAWEKDEAATATVMQIIREAVR